MHWFLCVSRLIALCDKVQQPMATQPLTNWSSGLFDCCEDISTCKNKLQNFIIVSYLYYIFLICISSYSHRKQLRLDATILLLLFFRLLWFLVLPLPCLHSLRKFWGEPLSPIMWHLEPCHNIRSWNTSVCASCSLGYEGCNTAQIWYQGE